MAEQQCDAAATNHCVDYADALMIGEAGRGGKCERAAEGMQGGGQGIEDDDGVRKCQSSEVGAQWDGLCHCVCVKWSRAAMPLSSFSLTLYSTHNTLPTYLPPPSTTSSTLVHSPPQHPFTSPFHSVSRLHRHSLRRTFGWSHLRFTSSAMPVSFQPSPTTSYRLLPKLPSPHHPLPLRRAQLSPQGQTHLIYALRFVGFCVGAVIVVLGFYVLIARIDTGRPHTSAALRPLARTAGSRSGTEPLICCPLHLRPLRRHPPGGARHLPHHLRSDLTLSCHSVVLKCCLVALQLTPAPGCVALQAC